MFACLCSKHSFFFRLHLMQKMCIIFLTTDKLDSIQVIVFSQIKMSSFRIYNICVSLWYLSLLLYFIFCSVKFSVAPTSAQKPFYVEHFCTILHWVVINPLPILHKQPNKTSKELHQTRTLFNRELWDVLFHQMLTIAQLVAQIPRCNWLIPWNI